MGPHGLTRRSFLLASTATLAAASRAGRSWAAAPGGALTIAMPADAEPATLDGQIDPYVSAWLLNSFVTDPLVMLTSAGRYIPMLATGWTSAAGGRVWTLTLRPGVVFQDGTPFDAEAVKFNLERVMNPETHSALMANYLGVKNYLKTEAPDRLTLRIIYGSPVPALLYGLSICPLWSPAAVKQFGTSFPQHLVGEGAFRLAEWVRGDHVRFVRNRAYHGTRPWQEHEGAAYLESITVRFVGDQGVLGQILKTGEVNLVAGLPAQAVATYANNAAYQLLAGYQSGNGMMFSLNTARPMLNDVRVRRALRYAYDQDQMNQTLYGGSYVTVKGPLTKYTLYYWKGADNAYRLDSARARVLLDEAGWKENSRTGVREKDGRALTLTMVMLHHKEIGEYLAAQLRVIGADLRVEVVPGPVQLQRAQSGDFDLIYERLRSYEPDLLFDEFYSKNYRPGGWAWTRYQNAALDKALLDSQSTTDPARRQALFTEAQKIVTDEALYLPTLDDPQYYAMTRKVHGFRLGATGSWCFLNDVSVDT
jgi:peptide/nickel transport system substrate-binding protein